MWNLADWRRRVFGASNLNAGWVPCIPADVPEGGLITPDQAEQLKAWVLV